MGEREELARVLLALNSIAYDHRPATPPDFNAEDPEDWTTGTPATHKLAFPPRGPMVEAVIDAILASEWLKARDQRVREECAKVVRDMAEAAHNRAFDLWDARERGYRVTVDKLVDTRDYAICLEQLADKIAAIRGDAK